MNLNFTPFPELQTDRLRLRRMTHDDANDLFFLRSHHEVMKYIDRPMMNDVNDAIIYIDGMDGYINRNEVINWGITLKENNKLIGTVGLFTMEKENFRCEAGYLLHPDFHRKGIMTETLRSVLDYAFTTLKFHSITANVNPANDASKLLLTSLGFEQEAYFRESYYFNGRFIDSAIYCIISPV
jgi:[ribosomal protein S5]-alanine N-acetyltransferase